jgi:hypothetical protein
MVTNEPKMLIRTAADTRPEILEAIRILWDLHSLGVISTEEFDDWAFHLWTRDAQSPHRSLWLAFQRWFPRMSSRGTSCQVNSYDVEFRVRHLVQEFPESISVNHS